MVTISRQDGFHIFIYSREHGIPHVHVASHDFSASVAIETGAVIGGSIPPPHHRRALRWIAENRDMLLTRWAEIAKL